MRAFMRWAVVVGAVVAGMLAFNTGAQPAVRAAAPVPANAPAAENNATGIKPGRKPRPDLVGVQLGITTTGSPSGCDLGTLVKISNTGKADAAGFDIQLKAGQLAPVTVTLAGLAAGAEQTVWIDGNGYMGGAELTVDPRNQVAEANEANNTHYAILPVPTPRPECM